MLIISAVKSIFFPIEKQLQKTARQIMHQLEVKATHNSRKRDEGRKGKNWILIEDGEIRHTKLSIHERCMAIIVPRQNEQRG